MMVMPITDKPAPIQSQRGGTIPSISHSIAMAT